MVKNTPPWPLPYHRLIGHRGAKLLAPENTLEGLECAHMHGLNWVEVDVQQLKSGEFVIFHDATLDRTTNACGVLFEHTYQELCHLEVGNWFSPPFQACRIPSLQALIERSLALNLQLNLEVKITHSGQLSCAQSFCTELLSLWPKQKPLPLISSFHWQILRKIRELLPEAWLGYLMSEWGAASGSLIFQPKTTLHCNQKGITPQRIQQLPNNHCPILVYTVNDPKLALAYLQAGAYAVFTDDPTLKTRIPKNKAI